MRRSPHAKYDDWVPTACCPRCGSTFQAALIAGGRLRKYCSRGCAFPGKSSSLCAQCGVTYTRPAHQLGKFCSRACTAESFKRRTAASCLECGQGVERANWELSDTVFCSVKCKHMNGRSGFTCFHCGSPVRRATWTVRDAGKAYCSRKCTSESRRIDPAWQEHARQMQSKHIRSRGETEPERILYELLCLAVGTDGFLRQPSLLGRHPDAAIPELRIAFQADGDYWHGSNAPAGNRRADESFNRLFKREGWIVVRLWESDLKRDPGAAYKRIKRIISQAREQSAL